MTSAYDKLRAKRTELLKQVEEIDAVLKRYAEIDEAAQRLISERTVAEPLAPPQEEHSPKPSQAKLSTPIAEFEKQLRSVLEEIERPISRQNLLKVLRDRGVVIGGTNELNTLGTRLYRTDWVVNLKGHGYWHRDREYKPAGHAAGEMDMGPFKMRPVSEGEESDPTFPGYKMVEKNS